MGTNECPKVTQLGRGRARMHYGESNASNRALNSSAPGTAGCGTGFLPDHTVVHAYIFLRHLHEEMW